MKRPPERSFDSPPRRQRKSKAANSDEPLDPAAEARYEALREVRSKLAKRDKIVSFAVMHDSTLREVARRAPTNIAALLNISGIGPIKAEKYGAEILAALRTTPQNEKGGNLSRPMLRLEIERRFTRRLLRRLADGDRLADVAHLEAGKALHRDVLAQVADRPTRSTATPSWSGP